MSILETIVATKQQEIAIARQQKSLNQLQIEATQYNPRGFKRQIEISSFPTIIAEIKRASPSKGLIRPDLDPVTTASDYASNGAACISVLTDEQYFKGHLSFLTKIREHVPSIPLLRKDFIIDPYQIWEARAYGADAVLLIVKALTVAQLTSLLLEANQANLDVLLEIHDNTELSCALSIISDIIKGRDLPLPLLGINNRNLSNFVTDINTTGEIISFLRKATPEMEDKFTIVSESGIFTATDIRTLNKFGAKAFLIGESLVAKGNPGKNLRDLINTSKQAAES